MKALFALMAFTNPALADCIANERTFISCTFANGKQVEVCMTDTAARYSFGRPGQTPELHMSYAFGEGAEAIPWSGMGRDIWDGVRFYNGDVIYEVFGGFDRTTAADETSESKFGVINVLNPDGSVIARLECIPDTVDYAF